MSIVLVNRQASQRKRVEWHTPGTKRRRLGPELKARHLFVYGGGGPVDEEEWWNRSNNVLPLFEIRFIFSKKPKIWYLWRRSLFHRFTTDPEAWGSKPVDYFEENPDQFQPSQGGGHSEATVCSGPPRWVCANSEYAIGPLGEEKGGRRGENSKRRAGKLMLKNEVKKGGNKIFVLGLMRREKKSPENHAYNCDNHKKLQRLKCVWVEMSVHGCTGVHTIIWICVISN